MLINAVLTAAGSLSWVVLINAVVTAAGSLSFYRDTFMGYVDNLLTLSVLFLSFVIVHFICVDQCCLL